MNTATKSVYLLDVNVLIALAWPQHIHHRRSRQWWRGIDGWATTPFTEAAFLRLSMNPVVAGRTVSMVEVLAGLARIRAAPRHQFLADDSSLSESQVDLARVATSRQVTDAHLVNLAANKGLVLATLDRGIPEMLAREDRRHALVLPMIDEG